MSACSSILLLLGATITVAICSEFLVDSIEGVTEEYGLPGGHQSVGGPGNDEEGDVGSSSLAPGRSPAS